MANANTGRGRKLVLFILASAAVLVLVGCDVVRRPEGWSAGTVSDDTLFIGTMQGEVMALGKDDGSVLWRFELPTQEDADKGIYGSPAVFGDITVPGADATVLVGGYDGVLYAYSSLGGGIKWQERLAGRIVGGPVVAGSLALVGTGAAGSSDRSENVLYAVDLTEGDPVWEYNRAGPIWSSPTVSNGVVYFGSLDHYVYAVNVDDGSEKWKYRTGGAVTSGVAVYDGLVIFGGFDSNLYALDAETGILKWKFPDATRWYWAAPLVQDGVVYAPSLDGALYALEADTGDLIWKYFSEGQLIGTPAIINDLIAVPVADGGDSKITLLEKNGTQQAACRIGADIRTSLEVSGDLIYFAATDHSIMALRIKPNGNPDEEWIVKTDEDDPHPRDRAKAC